MGKERLPTSSDHAILVAVATLDWFHCGSRLIAVFFLPAATILPHITSLHGVDFVLCCGVQKYTLALQ